MTCRYDGAGRHEETRLLWIVIAFFAGAYGGAILFGAMVAWRDLHPRRRGRQPPPVRWDFGPRTVTKY